MAGDITIGTNEDEEEVLVPERAPSQYSHIFGGSGFGKTYLSCVSTLEQLKYGAAGIVLDPECKTVHRFRGACQAANALPERVVIVDAAPYAATGMNLFYLSRGSAASTKYCPERTTLPLATVHADTGNNRKASTLIRRN